MPYKLTPAGETVALRIPVARNPEEGVLIYLYEHPGPTGVDVDELVGELSSSESVILKVVNKYINRDPPYLKEV